MSNYRNIALNQLGFTLADLRSNADARKQVYDLAASLEAAGKRSRDTDTVKQATVAACLGVFAGFRDDPNVYGPTVADVQQELIERGYNVKGNAVAQHLAKMRTAGAIDSMRMLESPTGGRGAPPVFYFLANEEMFDKVLSGELVCKG